MQIEAVGSNGLLVGRRHAVETHIEVLGGRSRRDDISLSFLEAHHPLYQSSPRILRSAFAVEDSAGPRLYVSPPD